MTGWSAFKSSYDLQVNTDVVGQTTENSVDTSDVGDIGLVLAAGLDPFINKINNFTVYTGTAVPSSGLGVEGDYYWRTNGGVSLGVYRKDSSAWALQATVPLGISYQDGIIIGLRTQIDTDALAVTVSSGSWAINNTIYSKSIATVLNYDTQEIGSDRIDTIYADTLGQVLYIAGAPSGSPVKPTLPANTIEVDSIYVPADGTGLPYLFSTGQAGSVPSIIKTVITGDQDDITLDNGYGKLTTPLNKNSMFTCEVTPTIGDKFKISEDMLLGNVLFGFPNPDTNNFTFEITYI